MNYLQSKLVIQFNETLILRLKLLQFFFRLLEIKYERTAFHLFSQYVSFDLFHFYLHYVENPVSVRSISIPNPTTSPSPFSENRCCAVPMSHPLEDRSMSSWSCASRSGIGTSPVELAAVAFVKEGLTISPRRRDIFLCRIPPRQGRV